jgi:hypothetical protein
MFCRRGPRPVFVAWPAAAVLAAWPAAVLPAWAESEALAPAGAGPLAGWTESRASASALLPRDSRRTGRGAVRLPVRSAVPSAPWVFLREKSAPSFTGRCEIVSSSIGLRSATLTRLPESAKATKSASRAGISTVTPAPAGRLPLPSGGLTARTWTFWSTVRSCTPPFLSATA